MRENSANLYNYIFNINFRLVNVPHSADEMLPIK